MGKINRDATMHELEERAKRSWDNDMTVDNFATLSAIKGYQFGREIYSSVIKFKDLMDFLDVFPEVQRDINRAKILKIKRYVLSGINEESPMRFFSGITVTARGMIFYDDSRKKIAIDTRNSKLSVNDGQHRFYGIAEAIRDLNGKLNKAKSEEEKNDVILLLNELKNMVIPLIIFNQLDEAKEAQLFHDLNNLAQRPSRSATIKLAQTDLLSHLAREISKSNKYLVHYGVEMDKMSIHQNNPRVVLLTTVYASIKNLFWSQYKERYRNQSSLLTKKNYDSYKDKVNETFDEIFINLPHDINVKGKYLIEKNYTLKGITKFIHDCRNIYKIEDEYIFRAIKDVDWSADYDLWKDYGATVSKRSNMLFNSSGGGIHAVMDKLFDTVRNYPELQGRAEKFEQQSML